MIALLDVALSGTALLSLHAQLEGKLTLIIANKGLNAKIDYVSEINV